MARSPRRRDDNGRNRHSARNSHSPVERWRPEDDRDDRYDRSDRPGGRRRHSRNDSRGRSHRDGHYHGHRDTHRGRNGEDREPMSPRHRNRDSHVSSLKRRSSRSRSPAGSNGTRTHRRHDSRERVSKRPRVSQSPPRRRRHASRSPVRRRSSRDEANAPAPRTEREHKPEDEQAKPKINLDKVEQWKQKRLLEKAQKEAQINNISTPPATDSPAGASSPGTGPDSPFAEIPDGPGKRFDPKAFSKQSAGGIDNKKAALGGDVFIPKSASAQQQPLSKAVDHASTNMPPPGFIPGRAKLHKGSAKISSFGLTKTNSDKLDTPMRGNANLEDEEVVERRLEKLPRLPTLDSTPMYDVDDSQQISSDDEDTVQEARLAAQKRAQAAADKSVTETDRTDDVAMDDAKEEDVDPLDAFMSTLQSNSLTGTAMHGKKKGALQVFETGDDQRDMDAVGDPDNEEFLAKAAKKKKKDIPKVDHNKVEYDPFRKAFYSEPLELAEMDETETQQLRDELEGIQCHGVDIPKPITKWAQAGLSTQILEVIRSKGFEKPTPIQCQSLPTVMSGRDVIGIAKTGSGKTLAFILPMFRHVKDQRPLENLEGPIGLVLAPTRELAVQIHKDCIPYCKALGLRSVCAYGGAPIKDQIAELKRGAEIVVCTPGRMIDLLAANSGRVVNLQRVTYVVLDEADRMFDMGFEPQIFKITELIRPTAQKVLFSATFKVVLEKLARKVLDRPVEILVGGRSTVAPEVTQIIEVRPESKKFVRTLELLGQLHDKDEDARSLIFVEKQETADSMFKYLASKGYPAVSVHGGRDQIDRDQAISDFKAGIYPVMVATSVAARGLDVKQLKLVINYDSPNHGEDYVHRCGRTGRAGNTGTAVTFVTPEQARFAKFLIQALKDSNREVPPELETLNEEHEEKVKAGQAAAVTNKLHGFGGRGIDRFDAARDAERAALRKQFKTGDEPEEEDETDDAKKNKKKVEELLAKATGGVKELETKQPEPAGSIMPTKLADHLDNALKVQKAEPAVKPSSTDPLARVNAAAASINSRLGAKGATRPGAPIDNRGPDAGAFHATLEINDFPQKARWSVTNRTNVAKILDQTGTSITTKGNYYAQGTQPEPGQQPKLYILVEGDTENVVEAAMRELTRLLREGTLAALELEARAPTGGRYSVV